jgi:hypothetical protein
MLERLPEEKVQLKIPMSKDEARKHLENYLINKCFNESYDEIKLPIKDAMVLDIACFDIPQTIKQYTFKGLLCIAYGLHE